MIFYIVLVLLILLSSIAPQNSLLKNRFVSSFLFILTFILLIVSIPFNIFTDGDMPRYLSVIPAFSQMSLTDSLTYVDWEPLFVTIQWLYSQFSLSETGFIIFIFSLYFFIYYLASRNLFNGWQILFFFFTYLNFSIFYSYIFNGVRQGLAMATIILIISLILSNKSSFKKTKVLIFSIVATLFHYSSALLLGTLLVIRLFKMKLTTILFIWSLTAILYITNLNKLISYVPIIGSNELLLNYSESSLIEYFGGSNKDTYLIFSLIFLVIFLLFLKAIPMEKEKRVVYINLIKIYTAFNAVFLFFGFIAFANRLATYSWILIPLILIYPIINSNRNERFLLFGVTIVIIIIGLLTRTPAIFSNTPF